MEAAEKTAPPPPPPTTLHPPAQTTPQLITPLSGRRKSMFDPAGI
jgi:hypothetical protein